MNDMTLEMMLSKPKVKVYIASDIFSQERKDIINTDARVLRQMGFEVYVPHEHEIDYAHTLSNQVWARRVFQEDVAAIDGCDILYYICEGMTGDIGAAWECGYAYAKGKRIRVEELHAEDKISLMVAQTSENEIKGYQS